jgi:hypothetical protein
MQPFWMAYMRKRLINALAIASSLWTCAAGAAQKAIVPQDSPIKLLKQIYGQYPDSEPASDWHKADKNWSPSGDVDKVAGWSTLPLSHETAALNKRVDKALQKDGSVCIDYDLISDSQDPDIARYKIVAPPAKSTEPAEYQIYFQGKSRKGMTKVSYFLVAEQGKWHVDDIVTYSTNAKGHAERNDAKDMLKACLKN